MDTGDLTTHSARLEAPEPVQARIPLTLGSANSTLLRWAGQHADIVGLTGFGRTLPDGHSHEVRWRRPELDAQIQHVTDGAAQRDRPPSLEALVQQVMVTDDAGAAVADLSRETGVSEEDLLASPFLLVGTQEEISTAIVDHERRYGITRFVVRENAIGAAERLIAAGNP